MTHRIINFNPGPSALPLPVLESIQKELLDYDGTGMSVMEISHRSKQFDAILADCQALILKHLGVGEEYKVLFMGGGASTQFALIALNLMGKNRTADYVNTGTWSTKAIQEARIVGKPNVAASTEEVNFSRIPKQDELKLTKDAVFVHITSNNTIKGTQWHQWPKTNGVPLIIDMSSDMLCRKVDMKNVGMIYAGAQKNMGPSGVCVVIMRDDMIAKIKDEGLPTMMKYRTYIDKNSLYNTPPVFPIYAVKKVMEWIDAQGGIEVVEKNNRRKGEILYGYMDENADYYRGTAEKDSRSLMNVTMRLPTEDLEKEFIAKGLEAGFGGLKGHRSVGGIRVSMYNAISVAEIEKLIDFMKKFKR
ncbi:MAG: 3-phosphoserine/phosphohydroxythreonine transaminase [Planctomycetes bacterium]|nr:3-phosphoserine/phosphohydroxythreonine transaminase [Planctomycetota bacterium]